MDNAGRLDLASRVFYYFRQQAGNTDPPAYEYLSDQDLMAALIGDMRHYADWRGVDFGRAVAAGNSAYFQHRAGEEYPYSLGEEVEHPQPRPGQDSPEHSASLAGRGIVTPIYPERDGTQTYYSGSSEKPTRSRSRAQTSSPHQHFPASSPARESLNHSPRLSGSSWKPARGSGHASYAIHPQRRTTSPTGTRSQPRSPRHAISPPRTSRGYWSRRSRRGLRRSPDHGAQFLPSTPPSSRLWDSPSPSSQPSTRATRARTRARAPGRPSVQTPQAQVSTAITSRQRPHAT